MKQKHTLSTLLLLSLFLPLAASAMPGNGAQTNEDSPTAASSRMEEKMKMIEAKKAKMVEQKETRLAEIEQRKQEKKEQVMDKKQDLLMTKALSAIDRRIEALDRIATRMMNRKRISEAEQAAIKKEIESVKTSLEAQKEKLQGITDLETLKATFKETIQNTRVFAVIIPKIRAIAMTSAMENAIARLNKFFTRMDTVIAKLPAEKQTEAKQFLADAKTAVAAARTKTDAAFKEFEQMKPAQDVSAAKTHLDAGKALLKDARLQIKLAMESLKKIRAMLPEQEQNQVRTETKVKQRTSNTGDDTSVEVENSTQVNVQQSTTTNGVQSVQ